MTIPSVREQLAIMQGTASPKPQRRERATPAPMKRSPIDNGPKRKMVRWEEMQYPAWEAVLRLHGLDFWHCQVAQRSQPGWPDYVVFGRNWLAFVELKATNLETGRRGKVSVAQERFKASIEAAGGEWRTFVLPNDNDDVDDWLNSHTGKGIKRSGRTA